jgi:hypothetical protein
MSTPDAATEVPPAVESQVAPVEELPASVPAVEAIIPAEDVVTEVKEEDKPEVVTKNTLLTRLFKPFSFSKVKMPKSPKKEKEDVQTSKEASTEATDTTAAEVPAEVTESSAEVVESKDTEAAPTATAPVVSEAEDAAPLKVTKAIKVGRRLSARVGDLFKYNKTNTAEVVSTPKVDECPPLIETVQPAAPLEYPAPEVAPEVKPADVTPAITATA